MWLEGMDVEERGAEDEAEDEVRETAVGPEHAEPQQPSEAPAMYFEMGTAGGLVFCKDFIYL